LSVHNLAFMRYIEYSRTRNVRNVLLNDLLNVRNVLFNVCNVSLICVIFYLEFKIYFINIDQVRPSLQHPLKSTQ